MIDKIAAPRIGERCLFVAQISLAGLRMAGRGIAGGRRWPASPA
jgi:hypothetical protein